MKIDYDIIDKALINFIKNETNRIRIKKTIIGLSGGLDSSLTAYLLAEALGKDNVIGVLMPYKTSSEESKKHGRLVADKLGIKTYYIDITTPVDAYLSLLDEEPDSVRKGNVMARIRMITLFDLSAKEKAVVVGTGNKSEILLGYYTMYGDAAYAFNPLGDLYKSQVFELAKFVGVPEEIINKPPSADLWEGQTDEKEMGLKYEEVDKLLYKKYNLWKTDEELEEEGYSRDYIDKVNDRVTKNAFKRVAPVIAKISNLL